MKKTTKLMSTVAIVLGLIVAGILPAGADWVPVTGGSYDYGLAANWTGGVSNNVFLPVGYSGSAQTVTLASDGVWNPNATVVTAHTNVTALILKATGSDRNLVLGGGIDYQVLGAIGEKNNQLQFGTVTANEKINFTLPSTVTILAHSTTYWYPQVIFNGAFAGAGGLNKMGVGSLYLQNAASTFTGPLNINAGQFVLATASTTLATTNIVIGRQDAFFNNNTTTFGVIGLLALGNGPAYPPLGTTSGANGANANRILDTATVDMRGGNLRLTAQDGNNSSLTETIGAINLTRGVNGLTLSPAFSGTNNVVTLAITALNRTAGSGFTALSGSWNLGNVAYPWGAFGSGTNLEGRITLGTINGAAPSEAMVNGIIPWAVNATQITGYYWATYYDGNFLTYDSYGLTPATNFVADINSAGATDNVRLYGIAPTLSADRTINSLTLYTINGGTAGLSGTGKNLTLTSGAINFCFAYNPSGGRLTIAPNLDFNGREAIVFLHQGPLQLTGVLSNTGGNGLTANFLGGNNNGYASLWLDNSSSYTGPTTINGGMLRVWGTSIPASSPVVINEGGGLDMRLSNVALASLAGRGIVWFQYWDAGSGNRTLTVGSDNTSTTYAGMILNNGPSVSGIIGNVVKTGTGTWTLNGTNTYTGVTTVSGGGLVIDGALGVCTNAVTVQTGAFLAGTGTIARDVTVNSGALLAAGLTNSVGLLNISSNLNLQAGAVLDVELAATNSYDRIVVGGTVNLNSNSGSGSVLRLRTTGTLARGQQFTIVDNSSATAVQGTFSCGSHITVDGNTFSISYTGGTGNDIVLTVLPKGTQIRVL